MRKPSWLEIFVALVISAILLAGWDTINSRVQAQIPKRSPTATTQSTQAVVRAECEQYYATAKEVLGYAKIYANPSEKNSMHTLSIANSLLYQNCVARNNK